MRQTEQRRCVVRCAVLPLFLVTHSSLIDLLTLLLRMRFAAR
jgi:hypothetical protein